MTAMMIGFLLFASPPEDKKGGPLDQEGLVNRLIDKRQDAAIKELKAAEFDADGNVVDPQGRKGFGVALAAGAIAYVVKKIIQAIIWALILSWLWNHLFVIGCVFVGITLYIVAVSRLSMRRA